MKPRHLIHRMLAGAISALAVFTLATGTHAATVTKAATGTDLTAGASWGGTAPGASDTATWASTSLGTGLTLGSDVSWSAIGMAGLLTDIDITGAGKITLGSGGTNGAVVAGISVSAVNLTLAAPVAVNVNSGVHQTWTGNAGKSIYASGLISGAGRLYKIGYGALVLSNPANSFSDLKVDEGIVRVTKIGAIGADKTIVLATRRAQLELDGSGGNITLPSGIGFSTSNPYGCIRNSAGNNTINGPIGMTSGGGGTKILSDGGTLVLAGNVSAGSTRNFELGGTSTGANTFSGALSNGSTPGFIKSDAGTWILTGNNTHTGATVVNEGIMQLSGVNGATSGATPYSLNGGSLVLDNTAAAGGNKADRIANTSTLSVNGGSLIYKGNDTVSSTETVGAVTSKGNNFATGNPAITVTFGGTNAATLTAASLVHTAGNAAFLVNGVSLGMDTASTASVARLIITSAPTLVGTTVDAGTGINAASQNTKIVPYLVGEATSTPGGLGTASGTANTFGTYTAGSGFRPLNPTDEFTQNAITTGNNTRITSATTAAATDAINSLVIAGGDLTINDGQTLTATSGAVLFVSAKAIQPSSSTGTLAFGSAEGMLTVNPALTSSVSAVISGSGGITKSGAGTLALSNTNTYSGVTTLGGGVLKLDSSGALPGGIASTGGTSNLTFNGGVLGLGTGNFTRSLNTAATATAATFTGPGGWAAYGADRLVNLGGASATIATATANTGFNGQMLILGAPDATHMVTLQNPLTLSGTAYTIQVNRGAAPIDAALSGALGGASTGILKTGTGILALTTTNTYVGSPSVVMAGTLLVNGSTSATDIVVVQNGATLGGSGTINGIAALFTGATLQPTVTGTPGTLTYSNATPPAFFPGTTLKIRATSPTTLDKVSLTNAASVFACGNLDLVFDCSSLSGTALNQTIVQTTNTAGICGTFHSVTATNGYTAILTYNANSITVVLSVGAGAGVAATLEVAGFPNSQTAGVAGSVTVTAKDSSGNPTTDYTGTIHFTSSDVAAVLPANYTFVPGDSGTHTFTSGVTFHTAGTQSITATDTVTGTITGTQSGITVNLSSAKDILTFGPGAVITGTNIAWGVPHGTNLATLAPAYTVSPLASGSPASGTSHNFVTNNPATYTITAQDGSTQTYQVTVTELPLANLMINLAYMNTMDGTATSEQAGTATQAAPLAYSGTTWNNGGNGSAAVSNLKYSDGSASGFNVSAVLRPRATGVNWGSKLGGNKLASYPAGLALGSVFAGDSGIMDGFVDILTFSGLATDHTYNIAMVDPGDWPATFKYLSQSAGAGQAMADWTSGKNYALLSNCIPNASGEITIQEKVSHDWSALCGWQIRDNGVRALNSEALIYTFIFPGAGAVTIAGTHISLTVPYGTPVSALSPTYTASPFATCAPASGSTHDFTSPVHYIIQSENTLTTTDYTVTVNVTPVSTAKDILTFGPGAVISGTNIVWTVPYATDLTRLTPAYTVSTFATGSPSSSTLRNFTTPQTYTVTAQDHSTKDYTVTIAVAPPSPAKNILTFGLPGNSASIDQSTRTITWSVPYGTDLATLAPVYTVTQFTSGSPASGVAQNFATTNPATYTLTAQDGSTQTYSVLVTVLPEMPTAINVNFAGGANPGNAWMNGIQSSDASARGSASRVASTTYSGNVWNDFSAAGSNSTSLLDSRGTPTGIGLTTTMQNGPGNTWTGLGSNRMLVSGLTSSYTSYTNIIALTGLNPAHTYNLYIASLHNTTAPTSTFRVGAVEKTLTYTTVTDWTDEKTHVQFTGLSAAADGSLTVEGKSTGELVLNGFQLVDTTPQSDITSFTFPIYGTATIAGANINISVPYGTNLAALAPTYTLSYGATCVPASGSSQNFTSPVHYLVRALDNSSKDYTVTVTPRAIPDPQFTLTAPATWDGRQTITVQSAVTNWDLLAANGGTHVNYQWSVAGVAVTKQISAGTLTLTRAQGNGPLTVTLVMDNGGWAVTHSATINIQQPASDAWVYRTPAADEKPVDGQFFARDDNGFGRIYYNGTQAGATEAFLRLYTTASGVETLTSTTRQTLTGGTYAFTVPIAAGLYKYRVEFGTTSGGTDTVTATVSNLICGDAYIIEGQSNAEAGLPNNGTPPEADYYTSEWIRSYGNVMAGGTPCTWGTAVRSRKWGSSINGQLQIGDWGIDLAKQFLEKHNMPICIINGALGGTRIDEHLRNEANHEDSATIYGRLLTRIEAAKLTHGIRGVFWHQGEQDQGRGGPYGGDFDYKWYQQNFVDLSAAWKLDYPNIKNYYIYQIWPAACGDTSANDMLRETQRTLPKIFSNMRIMTTIGVEPGSGCHFDLDGYQMFAELLRPMVEQDNYGRVPDETETFTPPNLQRAYFTDASHYDVALEFDQEMDGLSAPDAKGHFYLDGVAGLVSSVSTSGKVITLRLSAASSATSITYLKGAGWDGNQAKLLRSARGLEIIGIDINGNNASLRTVTIAALTFANVPIASTSTTIPDPFASWVANYYATPGDPKAAANADPDGDGLKNSVEYVLGSRPDTSNPGGPRASNVGANFVVTFQRALASKNAYTHVVIEVGTDLGIWPHSYDVDTAPEVAISAGLDADHETVTLTLPRTPDASKFARLKVITTAP